MLIYFRLSKAGYGFVKDIETWNAREVLQALYYEKFCDDFERAYVEMNKS